MKSPDKIQTGGFPNTNKIANHKTSSINEAHWTQMNDAGSRYLSFIKINKTYFKGVTDVVGANRWCPTGERQNIPFTDSCLSQRK